MLTILNLTRKVFVQKMMSGFKAFICFPVTVVHFSMIIYFYIDDLKYALNMTQLILFLSPVSLLVAWKIFEVNYTKFHEE